ncbi:MAG TPA: 30S ribosomal protein S6 [Armatimonadota bacterium]|nr:30S ribosomal protein S6 [Armatimonadota bacterium]
MTKIAIVRDYETLYIVDPNLTDEQVQAVADKYKQITTQAGGEVLAVEKWDKRRLAYEVAGKREGIYILMYFRGSSNVAGELNRVMRISEDVMRHIIVRDEVGQAAAAVERASRPAQKPAEAPVETPSEAQEEAPAAEEAVAEQVEEPVAEAEAPTALEHAETEISEAQAAEEIAAPEETPAPVEEVEQTEQAEQPTEPEQPLEETAEEEKSE